MMEGIMDVRGLFIFERQFDDYASLLNACFSIEKMKYY